MSILSDDIPALILIDIQKGFEDISSWGTERNNPEAEENARILLNLWRSKDFPIFHIQHCSSEPESLLNESNHGNDFKDIVSPLVGETIVKKNVNSAFIGTNLRKLLDTENISKVVIVGLTTDHCVSTTARMAGNYGYETYVVSDATATFDKVGVDGQLFSAQLMHETALASIHEEFGLVVSTKEIAQQIN
ncbi:cysteine hydrolase family protein [Flavobacterium soyangense]|uniref:Cysteine hydrolase n=1 Tax=Flavobacterium soyangense TaxID=2023265 RepID=A0A930UC61_9FLAO|nr:cysteine hydrolase family protein [Flavobacterium soyangense]MBF2708059.1 cysteine hydrolase [Flavobacterium soyangense]